MFLVINMDALYGILGYGTLEFMHIFLCIYVFMYICIYVFMYLCIFGCRDTFP